MNDVQIFFLFVLPLVIALMGGIILLSIRSGGSDEVIKGPTLQDTFEEMDENE